MTVKRIWKNTYSLSSALIVKHQWDLVAHEQIQYDGTKNFVVSVVVNGDRIPVTYFNGRYEGENQLTKHFDSMESVHDFVNGNGTFIIFKETRYELLTSRFKNDVLSYSVETNEDGYEVIVATWNLEKADKQFFELGRYYYGFNIDEAHGKTVSEVCDMIDKTMNDEYSREVDAMCAYYYGYDDRECSCRGGGCISCSPKDFL